MALEPLKLAAISRGALATSPITLISRLLKKANFSFENFRVSNSELKQTSFSSFASACLSQSRKEMTPVNLESGSQVLSLTATPQIPEMKILTLPSELQLEIFSYLDPVSSTCLGLSCKRFYAIHVHNTATKKNNKVSLEAWVILPANRLSGRHLFELLGDWMPFGLAYSPSKLKFIDRQELEESMKAMSPGERELQGHVAEMRCIQQRAKAWKEEGGWYEGGVWQILYVPRPR